MQAIQSVITAYCYLPFTRTAFAILFKFPQHFAVDNLCCLLSLLFFIFVQFSRCTLRLKPDTNLQPSVKSLYPTSLEVSGGPKWTRTTDLTIISRAL